MAVATRCARAPDGFVFVSRDARLPAGLSPPILNRPKQYWELGHFASNTYLPTLKMTYAADYDCFCLQIDINVNNRACATLQLHIERCERAAVHFRRAVLYKKNFCRTWMTPGKIDKSWRVHRIVVNVLIAWFSCALGAQAAGRGGAGGRARLCAASRSAAPAPQLFIRACSARVFFALPDWNSLRDRRCRWQTSCDMSAVVRALRTRQLTSHLTRITSRTESPRCAGRCFWGSSSLFKEQPWKFFDTEIVNWYR